MAGLSPFQFSSNKLQNETSLGSVLDSATSWYEMWVNPANVVINDTFIQQTEHTAGAIVTYHYRRDLAVMEVKGSVGWIMIKSVLDEKKDAALSLLRHPVSTWKNKSKIYGEAKDAAKDSYQNAKSRAKSLKSKEGWKDLANENNPFKNQTGASNRLNNSPRRFLERLRDLAYEPTYYFDSEGREHYNAKYIKMYTKQYPDGIICEGFFKNFSVPETSDDVQTINYSFTFVIQDMQVVTIIQKVAGMFNGMGTIVGAGKGLL